MKKYLMLVLFLLICSNLIAQTDCACSGLINWEYEGQVYIYNSANGSVIDSISNDSASEDFLTVSIHNQTDEFFKAIVIRTYSDISKAGWIKKADYIGTYARNYGDDDILNLYSKPDITSKVESTINEWIPELYQITNCHGNWVKVQLSNEERTYTGWLNKNMQCANAYTTCN